MLDGITRDAETKQSARQWYAIRVKSRHERVVATAVDQEGVEAFLPVYRCLHTWSDRSKSVTLPLFPGYVFCRLRAEDRFPLLTIRGVLHFAGFGKTPVPVDDAEVAAIQIAVRSELRIEPLAYVETGNRVRLESGPLGGLEGFLLDPGQPNLMVINLSLLRRSVAVEIEGTWVDPLAECVPSLAVHAGPLSMAKAQSR